MIVELRLGFASARLRDEQQLQHPDPAHLAFWGEEVRQLHALEVDPRLEQDMIAQFIIDYLWPALQARSLQMPTDLQS